MTPSIGRFDAYERVQGMLIPTSAEVAWVSPEGYTSVRRGRIVAASYDFAAQPHGPITEWRGSAA